MPNDQTPQLLALEKEQYGDEHKEHLFEQYKLLVASADNISDRRTRANNYLLTVNSALLTLYGISLSFSQNIVWELAVPISGVLICITWVTLIKSYRDINTIKFQVIHEYEEKLPSAPFSYEWHLAEEGKGSAYTPISHLEPVIPWVFGIFYFSLGVYALIQVTTA